MISNIRYWFLLLLVLLVYAAGFFVPLFENDSARFAVIAMRMVQENDYFNLLTGSEAYLDKPHMPLWLTVFSYKIFGIHDWAYRIPGLLATLLAAYSCYGLGRLLYNSNVGKLAALVFLTAQIIVLSNTDVRIDIMLTGFSIFALWQFMIYFEKGSLSGVILGAIGAGLTFSTSGLNGLLFITLPLLCHLIYTRKWRRVFDWRIGLLVLIFCLTISPICYAYYWQFRSQANQITPDSDSQTIIFSFLSEIMNTSLGDQRLSLKSFDVFYFKTFLWALLPWSIIVLLAYMSRFKSFLRLNFSFNPKYEFLSLGGITLLFLVLAFSSYKSNHNLNSLMPLFSILVASYLYSLKRFHQGKLIKAILGIQYFLFAIVFLTSVLLCYYIFKSDNPLNYSWKIVLVLLAIFYSLKRESYYYRLITVSVISSLMINAVLNTHTFPELVKYQSGYALAGIISEKEIRTDNIYKLSEQGTWVLDFYNKRQVKHISINEILNKRDIWVYANQLQLRELSNLGYDWDRQYQVDQIPLSDIDFKFLDPATRSGSLSKVYLIHIY